VRALALMRLPRKGSMSEHQEFSARYGDWRNGLIPPRIFEDWLLGEYLLGARQSVENEVLGWSLLLRGVYSYSVYMPAEGWEKAGGEALPQRTAIELHHSPYWRLLHVGYCTIDMHDGQLVMAGFRILTGPDAEGGGLDSFHSPIYWRSSLTKVEASSPHAGRGEDKPKCSFVFRVCLTGPRFLYGTESQAKVIAARAWERIGNHTPWDPAQETPDAPQVDPHSMQVKDSGGLLNYLRSETFAEDVSVISEETIAPLRGLVVIDDLHPPPKGPHEAWHLFGHYQQLLHAGKWGRICFTRVGGLYAVPKPKGGGPSTNDDDADPVP
jgi:hypothetical protein